jgi:hypothetical protein
MVMSRTEAADLEISYLHTNYLFLCPTIRHVGEESVILVVGLQMGDDQKVLEVHYHVGPRNMTLLY